MSADFSLLRNGPSNSVVCARVPQAQALDITAYTYYHGNDQFTSDRISLSALNSDSPELLQGLTSGQGHMIFSQYYQKYIFFDGYISFIIASTADMPWGPWSDPITVYTPATTLNGVVYTPSVQEMFMTDDGKSFLMSYTDSNTLPVVNVVSCFLAKILINQVY